MIDAQFFTLLWKEVNSKTLYARWSLNYYVITYDCDNYVNLNSMPIYYSVKDADIDLNIQNRDYYTFEWKATVTFTSYPGGELRRVALTVSIVSE